MRSGAIRRRWRAVAVLAAAAGGAGVRAEEAVNPQYAAVRQAHVRRKAGGQGQVLCLLRAPIRRRASRQAPAAEGQVHDAGGAAPKFLPEDRDLNYSFQFDVGFRDRNGDFNSSGSCGHAGGHRRTSPNTLHLGCGVDCDGGGLSVALADGDKSILVRLDSIAIWDASKPDAERTSFDGGADDHVFRLDRVKLRRLQDNDGDDATSDKPATM